MRLGFGKSVLHGMWKNNQAVARTPAQLSGTVLLWVSARSDTLFKTDGTAAGNGNAVKTLLRPGDLLSSPAFNYCVQSTSGDQPAAVLSGGRYYLDGGSSDRMFIATPLSILAATDWTMWFVGKRATSSILAFAGASDSSAHHVGIYSDNVVYVQTGSETLSKSYTGSNGVVCVYRFRKSINQINFASTGMADGLMTSTISTTLALDLIMARVLGSTFTASGNWFSDCVVMTGIATAADDTLMAEYHQAQFGAAL